MQALIFSAPAWGERAWRGLGGLARHSLGRLVTWLLACAACATFSAWSAEGVLPVPSLSGPLIDSTQTLSADQVQALQAKLSEVEHSLGSQVVILMVPSTQDEDIATFAQRVGEAWKIGRRDVGDGLLIVVAKDDHRVRIEVAKALEGAVPDLAAKQIIDRAITPAFKQGDFAGGLSQAIDLIAARIRDEALPLPTDTPGSPGAAQALDFKQLLVFGLVGVPLVFGLLSSVLGRKGGAAATGLVAAGLVWWLTTSLVFGALAWVIASVLALAFGNGGRPGGGMGLPMGGGGWGGMGGSSGGTWSSGGGGDFGGGGASGRW